MSLDFVGCELGKKKEILKGFGYNIELVPGDISIAISEINYRVLNKLCELSRKQVELPDICLGPFETKRKQIAKYAIESALHPEDENRELNEYVRALKEVLKSHLLAFSECRKLLGSDLLSVLLLYVPLSHLALSVRDTPKEQDYTPVEKQIWSNMYNFKGLTIEKRLEISASFLNRSIAQFEAYTTPDVSFESVYQWSQMLAGKSTPDSIDPACNLGYLELAQRAAKEHFRRINFAFSEAGKHVLSLYSLFPKVGTEDYGTDKTDEWLTDYQRTSCEWHHDGNTYVIVGSIFQLVEFEIRTLNKNKTYIKECELCKRYFVSNYPKAVFCKRENPDYNGKPCCDVGPHEKIHRSPSYSLFDRRRQTYSKWVNKNYRIIRENKLDTETLGDLGMNLKEIIKELSSKYGEWYMSAKDAYDEFRNGSIDEDTLKEKLELPSVRDRSPKLAEYKKELRRYNGLLDEEDDFE